MSLQELGEHFLTDKGKSYHDYFPHYEPYFAPFRDKEIRLLEIGVYQGASISLWLAYFPLARVFGIDLVTPALEPNDRFTFIGTDQGNAERMDWVGRVYGPFDIIIDDGSHAAQHQLTSWNALIPHMTPGGIYAIEDMFADTKDESARFHFSNTTGAYFYRSEGAKDDKALMIWRKPCNS